MTIFRFDGLQMKKSALILSGAFILAISGGVGLGFFLGHKEPPSRVDVRPLVAPIPVKPPSDIILQNGKAVSLTSLMAVYRANPNRFSSIGKKSVFHIEGHVAKVGEVNGTENISGFYVPLMSASDPVERALNDIHGMGEFSEPVSLFVIDLAKSQIESLNPGQIIKVDCPQVRIVTDSFVFDKCHLAKDAKR